jgi:gluconokinase
METVMAAMDGLRSAYAKVGDLVYFGRMLDKIRLADQNKLPADYNLGDKVPTWFDGNCCRFLNVQYTEIVSRVRLGYSDEQILEWAYETGRRPTQEEIMIWNSFMAKRGWRDKATKSLNRWKTELGLKDRDVVQTFFDLYDADEGRGIGSGYSPD